MSILSSFFRQQPSSPPSPRQVVFFDDQLRIAFPDAIATLEFGGREQYDQPGLGYSMRYDGAHVVKADVYVYDKGYSDIAEGALSERVLEEFTEVTAVFSAMEARGMYRDVREVAMGKQSYGKPRREYLWVRYEYQQAPGEGVGYYGDRASDTFLTGVKGKFFKIRITACKEHAGQWERLFEQFAEQTNRLLDAPAGQPV